MATGDRLQIADKPTLDNVNKNIGNNGDNVYSGTVQGKLNDIQNNVNGLGDTSDTGGSNNSGSVNAKLNAILEWIEGGSKVFTQDGQFIVPTGVTKLIITACGGGGGGGGSSYRSSIHSGAVGGGGGGGGAAILNKQFVVSPKQEINITIGVGGEPGKTDSNSGYNGQDGSPTIIGNLVTLAGGKGGLRSRYNGISGEDGIGGEPGGEGGGRGGNNTMAGNNGIKGKGGLATLNDAKNGGGGGGSLGNGGNGANSNTSATNGELGGGGGGGYHDSNAYSTNIVAGRGGNGYVKIQWGA